MDIWSRIFAEKFRLIIKFVSKRTEGKGVRCGRMWTRGRGGQKSLKMFGHPLWMPPKLKAIKISL